MKNSFVYYLIFSFVLIVLSLFVYVFSLNEIKRLRREKDILLDKLSQKHNLLEAKMVEVQKLSSEDRIVKLAKERFGLVRSNKTFEKLYVNNEHLEQIIIIVNSRYEK